jgi:HPt (histidine-containing phosphotransfer) domain-containing protein
MYGTCRQHAPLYSTLAGDPDLAELVELFVAEMPQKMAQFERLLEQRNWEQLGRTAHQFKGAAGSYGFHQLTPYAGKLESDVRGGAALEQIEHSLAELAEICQLVRAGVQEE